MRFFVVVVALSAPFGVAAQSVAHADDASRPKVLFVAGPTVPSPLRRSVPAILRMGSDLVPPARYAASVSRRDLRSSSDTAIHRYGTRQGADVIAVMSFFAHGRGRVIRFRFLDGRTGRQLHTSAHALRGLVAPPAVQHEILASLRHAASLASHGEVAAARPSDVADTPSAETRHPTTRGRAGSASSASSIRRFDAVASDPSRPPRHASSRARPLEPEPESEPTASRDRADSLPPPVDWRAPAQHDDADAAPPEAQEASDDAVGDTSGDENGADDDGEASSASDARIWGVGVTAGGGFGLRSAAIQMEAGPARLATTPFPVIHAALTGHVRPISDSWFRVGAAIRYFTSVGLVAQDQRSDGSTRSVDTRVQRLDIGVSADVPLASGERVTRFYIELGWGFRMLTSELPLALPGYTLSGPYARVGLFFPLGDGPLSLGIFPEVGQVSSVGDELANAGAITDGAVVGAEASIHLDVIPELAVDLLYRESHALLNSDRDGEASDVERFGVLRVTYRP